MMELNIIADLQAYHNPPETDHYCYLDLGSPPCRPFIITESGNRATVACPDTGSGYFYQRVKGGWVEMRQGGS